MRSSLRLCLALATAMLAGQSLAHAQQVLKVGYPPFGTPTTFIDSKTNLASGAVIDLVTAIGKETGMRVEFHPLLAGDLLAALNAKIIDVTAGGLQITPELQGQVDFSAPLYQYGEALVVKKSDPKEYKSWDDLKGEAVGANAGTIYVGPLQKSGLFKEVKIYAGGPAGYAGVIAGDIKAYVTSATSAAGNVGLYPDLQVAKTYQPKMLITAAFAYRKGQDDVVKKVDAALAKLKADGTMKTAFTKYGADYLLK